MCPLACGTRLGQWEKKKKIIFPTQKPKEEHCYV